MSDATYACDHLFDRHGRRKVQGYLLPKPWWKCVLCGYEAPSYNGIDRAMVRPIHPRMSVVLPGYNTVIQEDR
jgi:hypothetical protein